MMAYKWKAAESSFTLDEKLQDELAGLIEELTTTGSTSLDPETMKKLKKICKKSDGYIEFAYTQLMEQLSQEHAEIRLSSFQVINELFQRSHKFRQMVVAEMQQFLLLAVETDADSPLPPPKAAAKLMKDQALRAVADWNSKYGKAYKKLGVGYNYLKHCKKVDFNNITAQMDAERERERVRVEQLERMKQERFTETVQQMTGVLPEIEKCLRETETCYDILFPKNPFGFETESVVSKDEHINARNSSNDSLHGSKSGTAFLLVDSTEVHSTLNNTSRSNSPSTEDKPPTEDEEISSDRNICMPSSETVEAVPQSHPSGNLFEPGSRCSYQLGGDGGAMSTGPLSERLHSGDSQGDDESSPCRVSSSNHNEEDLSDCEEGEGNIHVRSDAMQSHGVTSLVQSINIDIEIPVEGVALVENENNTDLIRSLDDAKKLLATNYASQVDSWIQIFQDANKTETDFYKKCLDMKGALSDALLKYNDLKIQRLSRVRRVELPADDSDDELVDVPEKEGFEPVIADDKREEYGLPPVKKNHPSEAIESSSKASTSKEEPSDSRTETAASSFEHHLDWHPLLSCEHDPKDPTSRAATLASLGVKEEPGHGTKRKLEDPTQSGTLAESPAKQSKEADAGLISRAPVIPYGVDLENWDTPENIKAPVILRTQTDNRVWISSSNETEVVIEGVRENITKRVFSFTGEFVPVKWKCRAPLPSGKLCERMDRVKCPFHGKIIPRNEDGRPSNPDDIPVLVKQEETDDTPTEPTSSTDGPSSSWQDPDLLRDIEGATGIDLTVKRGRGKGNSGKTGSRKGKGKGKRKAKYPGLTDLTQCTNTSRNRLGKRVFNKAALKRVNTKLTAMDNRRLRDKFSNQFHYALH